MTSEVLIVNPNSLSLAVDGAVTVKGKKTFTGVQKLLTLSNDPTIVVMYYGKPDFGLVDMESALLEFKKHCDFNELNTVKNVSDELIKFLKDFTYPDNVENFVKYYFAIFKRDLKLEFEEMDEKLFWDYINESETLNPFEFIENISFKDIIPENVSDIEAANNELLKIFSYYLANSGTGIVIAGFDAKNNRPSYIHIGLMVNNNGIIEYEILDIEENFNGSSIISFAQDNEINTFIKGIDSDLEESIINYIRTVLNVHLEDFYESLVDSNDFDRKTLNKIKKHKQDHEKEFIFYEKLFLENMESWKNDNYNSFLEIIPFLPKNHLAEFARFLIFIVSSKQKFSFDLESVSGKITVCVVTKNKIEYFD